jgi:hypothetical protein
MEKNGISFTDAGRRFGLSAFGAAQWVRGYYAFKQAKAETEFGGFIDERMYPYFQEIFGRSSIALKEWLGWDDEKKKFSDQANLNEFMGWFFPVDREEPDEAEDGLTREPTEAELTEAWERRWITKRDDLRNIAYLITKAPKEWMKFRSGDKLDKVYSSALLSEMEKTAEDDRDAASKLFEYVSETTKLLEATPFSILASEERRNKLFVQLDKIANIYDGLKKISSG